MRNLLVLLLTLVLACSGQQQKQEAKQTEQTIQPPAQEKVEYATTEAGNPIVLIKTSMGDVEIEVLKNDTPIHASNFLRLVENDYYDGVIFHRVIADFMIQTGDPTGTGGGGPGYNLAPEPKPFKYENRRSYLAMAQSADGTINGSQFYILVKDSPHLNDKFPCFARVITGMEVVDAISKVKTDGSDRPIEPVTIIEAKPKPPVEQATDTAA